MNILSVFGELLAQSGFAALTWQQAVMLLISFILLYLAIKKQFEPLLLLPARSTLPDLSARAEAQTFLGLPSTRIVTF